MKKFVVLAALVAFTLPAFARENLPFAPALAADQPRLTEKAMEYEMLQFNAIQDWHDRLDQLDVTKRKREQLKRDLDRSTALVAISQISKEAYVIATFKHEALGYDISRLEYEATQAKAKALGYRLRVLCEGGAEGDFKLEIAQARVTELQARLEGLRAALKRTEVEHDLVVLREKNGRTLAAKVNLSQAALELRQQDTLDTVERIASLKMQITMAETALQGVLRALVRLAPAN